MDARIALLFQESAHFVLGEIGGYGDGERNGQARIRFLGVAFELPADRFSVVALYRFAAAATVQRAEARVQQLQVIVEFGHGAHGAARIAHRIDLGYGDGGQTALDALETERTACW